MNYPLKISLALVGLAITGALIWNTANPSEGEQPLSTSSVWKPYDGMAQNNVDQADYFAPQFMPVLTSPIEGSMALVAEGQVAGIYYSNEDAKVVEVAAEALRDDIQRVTDQRPQVSTDAPQMSHAVLIGTIGQSPLIDGLISAGKIDVSAIKGKWEAYAAAVVHNPLPGVDRGLIIAGSDRRGTAFGVFGLSESLGVSP